MEQTLRQQLTHCQYTVQLYNTLLEHERRKVKLAEMEAKNLVTLKEEKILLLEKQVKALEAAKMHSIEIELESLGVYGQQLEMGFESFAQGALHIPPEVQETNEPALAGGTPESGYNSSDTIFQAMAVTNSDRALPLQNHPDLLEQYNGGNGSAMNGHPSMIELQAHYDMLQDGSKPIMHSYDAAGGAVSDLQVDNQSNLSAEESNKLVVLEAFKHCVLSLPVDSAMCPCPVDLEQPPYDIAGISTQEEAVAMIKGEVKLHFWAYLKRSKIKGADQPTYRRSHKTGEEGRWTDSGTHLSVKELFPENLRKHISGRRLKWQEKPDTPSRMKWSRCQWMLDEYIATEARNRSFPVLSACPQLDRYPHLGYFVLWVKEAAPATAQPRGSKRSKRGSDDPGPFGEGNGSDEGSEHGGNGGSGSGAGGYGHGMDSMQQQDFQGQGNGGWGYGGGGGAQYRMQSLAEFSDEEADAASDAEGNANEGVEEYSIQPPLLPLAAAACSVTGGALAESGAGLADDLKARLQALRMHTGDDGNVADSATQSSEPLPPTGSDGDARGAAGIAPAPQPPPRTQQEEPPAAAESGDSGAPAIPGAAPEPATSATTPPPSAASSAAGAMGGAGGEGADKPTALSGTLPAGEEQVQEQPHGGMVLPFPGTPPPAAAAAAAAQDPLPEPLQQARPSSGPVRYPVVPPLNIWQSQPPTVGSPNMLQPHPQQQQILHPTYMQQHPGAVPGGPPFVGSGVGSFMTSQGAFHMQFRPPPAVLARNISMPEETAPPHPQQPAHSAALRRFNSAMPAFPSSPEMHLWQQPPPPMWPGSSPGAPGPRHMATAAAHLVNEVAQMGYARQEVVAVVRALIAQGSQLDVATVIRHLSHNGAAGQPPSWQGKQ